MGEVRGAVATLVAALAAAAAAVGIASAFHEPGTLAITAVAVTFFASRSFARLPIRRRWPALPVFAVVGIVAGIVGRLFVVLPVVGALLFVLGAAGTVWARRFGPRGRRIGSLAAAPFVSVLTVPIPVASGIGGPFALIAVPVVSITAAVLVASALSVADLLPPRAIVQEPPLEPQRAKRSTAPDRMAVQMLVALAAAFLAGWLLFPEHWPWVVLTAYIALVGSRGRGDVAVTVSLRLVGALGGAVLGELVGVIGSHAPAGAIAAIFVLLTVGRALRSRSYAWWAGAITGSLAILYALTGVSGPDVLGQRLLAILLGGAIAVAAAWFVLPIRTRDVLRRRAADVLAAAGAVLAALRAHPDEVDERMRQLETAGRLLRESTRPHRMHGSAYAAMRRDPPAGAIAVDAVQRLPAAVAAVIAGIADGRIDGRATTTRAELGAIERRIGDLRRVIGRSAPEEAPPLTRPAVPELAEIELLLAAARGPLQRLSAQRVSPPTA